jgi:hypothetical protein
MKTIRIIAQKTQQTIYVEFFFNQSSCLKVIHALGVFWKILCLTEFGHFLSTNNPYRYCKEGQKMLSLGVCE